jgi:protein phosphatase
MGVTAHGVTHPGPRASNEDAFLIDMPGGVFVVADGMGGHNAGEVASGLAVESIRTFVADEDRPSAGSLEDAVRAANKHILDTRARRPECAGMGTTVAVALVTPGGPSFERRRQPYLPATRRALTQLTQDDSWIASCSPRAWR